MLEQPPPRSRPILPPRHDAEGKSTGEEARTLKRLPPDQIAAAIATQEDLVRE